MRYFLPRNLPSSEGNVKKRTVSYQAVFGELEKLVGGCRAAVAMEEVEQVIQPEGKGPLVKILNPKLPQHLAWQLHHHITRYSSGVLSVAWSAIPVLNTLSASGGLPWGLR